MSRFISTKYTDLEAYTPGEQPQDMQYIKLNTNESPFPPSPSVLRRINEQEIKKLNLYPDPEGMILRKKLAELYGVGYKNILLSNGSDEILNFFYMGFCDNEKAVAFPDISYGFYEVYANLYHIPYVKIPLREDFYVDYRDYCDIEKNVVIANPNAPTGLALTLSQIEEMVKSNSEYVVLIDEAYVDFGAESCVELTKQYDNLLVVQTFSKSRSMAGGRLGLAIGNEELIADLNKLKYSTNPYNINRLTLVASEAIVEDNQYYMDNCRTIMENREFTRKALLEMGFEVTDSKANFLFARSDKIDGAKLYQTLKRNGILVRHFNKERISDFIRITIGTREQMEKFVAAVKDIIEK